MTIEALDKIRATLELLIEYGEIEKQGSLRETFNHYFHPERLELNDPRVYELISAGNISDLFQFNTEVGKSAVVKTAPTNLVELASANSLMRLLSDSGQQPIDTFTHYKEDIKRWYTDMTAFGLNEAEQKIMEKHLLIFNGVADTQESIMLLTMDEEIAGFTVEMANDLRSAVANFLSASAREKLEKLRKDFFSMGKERGTREVLLHYVWDVQIRRQLKYSFSILHTVSYTVIAIIEAFLNIHFNPLYWQTACLIANSYGQEDEEYDEEEEFGFESNKNNSRRYDKLSIAISNMQQEGVVVSLPDINQSSYSFTPIIEEGRIVYGLNGIVGVGEEVVNTLMSLRPFTDFDDFYQRAVVPKLVPNKAIIQLIKSGAFNSFGDRKQIMEKYRYYQNPPRKSLNMQNYTMMTRLKLDTDEHLAHEHQLVRFRNYITQKQFVIEKREKPKDEIIQLDRVAQPFYEDHFVDLGVVQINDGCYAISKSVFEKEYQKRIEPLRQWLKDSETIKRTNKALKEEWYIDNADESLQRWEMLSVGFYSDQHEIASVDKEEYEIVDFKELPRSPVVSSTYTDQRGRAREIYKLERIAGVVVGKTKNSNMVHLMTESGIVNVKLYGNMFSKYDRRIMEAVSEDKNRIVEHSWFTRGNRLIFTGVRRGDRFMPRVYKNHRFQSPVILINRINEDGSLVTQTERYSP